MFALLDLGVLRVGRWSCLTQRACVCLRVCLSVYLPLDLEQLRPGVE